jgi:COMPASS component SPP1
MFKDLKTILKAEKETEEVEIFCVTCGHSYNEKHALKHMERCFIKYESQAFFGSFFKSHPEGQSLFCDYYIPQTKMYCKRLKSMCPEHEKEKKVNWSLNNDFTS